jgi:hypothetical protein
VANAPVQLTQDYFECYNDEFNAFLNALGIATGNTSLAVPATMIILLPVIYLILVLLRKNPPREEYNARDKNQALEVFSILLLRLRDGKSRGIKPTGVLSQLTKEIISAAKEESGFPDSDDEYDSDDEGGEGDKKIATVNAKVDSDDDEDPSGSNEAPQRSPTLKKGRKSKKIAATANDDTAYNVNLNNKLGFFAM